MSPHAALHSEVFRTYLLIVAALLTAAGSLLALLTWGFKKNLLSVWMTYKGWLFMAPLVLTCIFAGRAVTLIFFTAVAALGFKEFARATGLYRDWWMTVAVYAGIIGVGLAALVNNPNTGHPGWYGLFMALPVYAIALLMLVPIARNQPAGQLQALALAILGFLYLGWMFLHLAFLANADHAYGYLLYLLLAVELNDVAAFTFGKLFGKHPFRSQISPRKTWQGAAGALAVSLALPWLLRFSFPHFGPGQLLLAGLIVGVGGQLGDLSISVIKRDIGIKDMGASIPGHGGVLDRIDSLYYSFERHIPFVPLMIVPYMSIDLFFVAAPFLCRSRAELNTLTRRIAFAIVTAGICFLLIPLRLAVPYPHTAGWTGAVFRFLHGFDQPYNLVPSLHITLWAILANHYAKHTRGHLRAAGHLWFGLICLSTLLTHQHHLVDVVGGFVLATFCFYLFRETPFRQPVLPNHRVGAYYAVGSLICLASAAVAWPWTSLLLWPALALGITASGYCGLGPGIYRKHKGKVPLSARLLLGPSLAGQFLSLAYYRRQCAPWNQVTPRVWVGARLNSRQSREAKLEGLKAVLDLTAELPETPEFLGLNYCNLPVLDLTGLSVRQLSAAVRFISAQVEVGVVYVHCKTGYSRSGAAVGAYLLASGQARTVEQALAIQRQARPTMVFRREVIESLKKFLMSQPADSLYPAAKQPL